MKRLLLLLPLLLGNPAFADLGAADTPIPGETFVDRYTAYTVPVLEAYCAQWRNKCTVEITAEHLIVDGQDKVHKDQLIKTWYHQLAGRGSWFYVAYQKDDGSRGTAQFIFSNSTAAAEFYNRLQLLMTAWSDSDPQPQPDS